MLCLKWQILRAFPLIIKALPSPKKIILSGVACMENEWLSCSCVCIELFEVIYNLLCFS